MIPVVAKLVLAAIGVGGLALMASKASASQSPTATDMPNGSAPDGTGWGNPVKTQAKANPSNRVYTVWMYPVRAGVGVYTIAQLAGSSLWISFTYNADTNSRTPAKTNVMTSQLDDATKAATLKAFKDDWSLPG